MRKADYIPLPTRHARGHAVVRLNGRDLYLGRYGSPEAHAKYNALIADWLANGRQLPDEAPTVNEVILAYLRHAREYYGGASAELGKLRLALRPVRKHFGRTRGDEFGPRRLVAVRDAMLAPRSRATCPQGGSKVILPGQDPNKTYRLARRTVNMRVGIIKRMFKWAVETELVPPHVFHGLSVVAGLRAGRSAAKEPKTVRPAPDADVTAVLGVVNRHVAALIRLQRLTGARSGELVILCPCDLDRSPASQGRPLWVYRPSRHKNRLRGQTREIYLGPQAQEILRPFLAAESDSKAFLFSPRKEREERYAELRKRRKSKVPPSQQNRRKSHARRLPGRRYTSSSYRHAIYRACRKAGIPDWHPHQLRHAAATAIRRAHGLELARIILGHATSFTTEVYAEVDQHKAMTVMETIG